MTAPGALLSNQKTSAQNAYGKEIPRYITTEDEGQGKENSHDLPRKGKLITSSLLVTF